MKKACRFKVQPADWWIFAPILEKHPVVPLRYTSTPDEIMVLASYNAARIELGVLPLGLLPRGRVVPVADGDDPTELMEQVDPLLLDWVNPVVQSGWWKDPSHQVTRWHAVHIPWIGQTPPFKGWFTAEAEAAQAYYTYREKHLDQGAWILPPSTRVACYSWSSDDVARPNMQVFPFRDSDHYHKSDLVSYVLDGKRSPLIPSRISWRVACTLGFSAGVKLPEKRLVTLRQYYKVFPRRTESNPFTPEEYLELLKNHEPTPEPTPADPAAPGGPHVSPWQITYDVAASILRRLTFRLSGDRARAIRQAIQFEQLIGPVSQRRAAVFIDILSKSKLDPKTKYAKKKKPPTP